MQEGKKAFALNSYPLLSEYFTQSRRGSSFLVIGDPSDLLVSRQGFNVSANNHIHPAA